MNKAQSIISKIYEVTMNDDMIRRIIKGLNKSSDLKSYTSIVMKGYRSAGVKSFKIDKSSLSKLSGFVLSDIIKDLEQRGFKV